MGLLENSIEIDLEEGTYFVLSEETQAALEPPAHLVKQLEKRPGERGRRTELEKAAERGVPYDAGEVRLDTSAPLDEVKLVLEAGRLLATAPSPEVLDLARKLLADSEADRQL